MKNVLKTLQSNKAEIQKEFDSLEQQRQQAVQSVKRLQSNLAQMVNQLNQLQGKYAAIDKLEQDFKDEPKEK